MMLHGWKEVVMSKRLLFVPVAAALVLAGCVTVPTGPAITVLPGAQKSFEQFRVDDGECRQYSQNVVGGPNAGRAANNAAATNAAAGTVLGAAVGAIIGSVSGQAGHGAAIGAGTGLLVGSTAGGNSAAYSSRALQRNYDTAYMQCMYSRGNQIPGRMAYRAPAPNYPPPSGPAGNSPLPSPNYPPPGTPPPIR